MSSFVGLRRIAIALMCAIALALVSVNLERVGPQLAQYGNLCGPSNDDPCYEPVLNGGFPIAYLFDAPGISVERQLSFGEDRLVIGALVIDIAFYFAIAWLALARRRHVR